MRILISKCGIYTSQGKRVLLATRAVVNGRKAVAYVKNGQLQGYEYLDDFNEQCYSGPYMTFEDKLPTVSGSGALVSIDPAE